MPEAHAQHTYEELTVGQTAAFGFTVTDETVRDFAQLSGDNSPLHVDQDYARTTEFKRPIAHGMIAGTLFSRLVGMALPGKYAVYLSQTMKFHHPMFAGDEIVVTGTIVMKNDAFHVITIKTEVRHRSSGKLLVDGEALVRVLK